MWVYKKVVNDDGYIDNINNCEVVKKVEYDNIDDAVEKYCKEVESGVYIPHRKTVKTKLMVNNKYQKREWVGYKRVVYRIEYHRS